jgi:uncharacterized protein (DUF2062 family)
LTQGVTAEKVALSIAVGSALALFPILGTTTTLCVIAGIALRLNQPVLQAINALFYPVYFPLIAAFVRLGDRVLGTPPTSFNVRLMASVFAHHPSDFVRQFGATALHAVLGWSLAVPLWIPLVYLAALPPLRAAEQRLARRRAAST